MKVKEGKVRNFRETKGTRRRRFSWGAGSWDREREERALVSLLRLHLSPLKTFLAPPEKRETGVSRFCG